tara:strand:+ start:2257 stop:2505 length:249 start_codon:yes stop_codon:yes gene_type:complete
MNYLKKILTKTTAILVVYLMLINTALAKTLGDSHASTPEDNLPYLFAVFALTWAGIALYIYYMSQKQREIKAELDSLKRNQE